MASLDLTRGAIAAISEGGAEGMKPVLQVSDVRLVNTTQSTTERYRMMLSDGVHTQQAMLATQMNPIVKNGTLQKGSFVQLNEFICNTIQGRRIIIVINLEVLVPKSDIIGVPTPFDSGASASQNRAPMSAQSTSINQPGMAAGIPQPYGGSRSGGLPAGQNMMGGASVSPKPDPVTNTSSYSSSYGTGPISGRNMSNLNSLQPKAEQGSGIYANSHPESGNQNQRLSNPGMTAGYQPSLGTYGRPPVQPTYQQPPPLYTNRGPIAKNEAPARIIPIAALNPYQGRWTIKARVTAKGELRRYNNPRGEGKVFSFDLLDCDGGEIRVTCFNLVADQFYDQIEVGRVYLISKGSLRPAQKSFNHLNNDYEIFLESTSTIQPCFGEDNSIPKQQFNFRPISEIEGMENNSMVDVIGIVTSISPAGTVMRKNGTETQKRTLQLKDMSGRSVEITLWGNFCSTEGQQLQGMCDSGIYPVLAIKAGRVSDFSGKSVGTISTSQLFINPDFPEVHRLKEWYSNEGKNVASLSISRDTSTMGRTDIRKTVSQIKDEGLGRAEKPDWITVKATVTFIKVDNFCYTACPLLVGDRQCNKKVNNNGDGTWRCDRCDQSFPECDYRYLLQFQIQDHTGMTWVTAFQECGEEIMGVSAKELYLLKYEEQDDVKFAEIIRTVLFNQYLFKLKVKEETFSDEQRVKSTVIKAEKVNPSSESRYLLGLIEKLSVEEPNVVSGAHGNFASSSGMSNAGFGSMDYKPSVYSGTNNLGNSSGGHLYRMEQTNQFGQPVNEYGGVMKHNIGNRETQIFCNNCGSSGHNFQNCPRGISRQGQSVGVGFDNRPLNAAMDGGIGSNVCFKCQQPGHWARDCPGLTVASSAYGSSGASGRYTKQYVGGF
ncbi:replication protein A 70 kDa DNA-binding subunit A-like [Phoenix dactylifera]|uniref:Replication protein A subunit n=1 Tax=Phoenix dactylifera TaxID=42345 RepID=A0A8B7BSQ4_PHODC|nr:replication protein A 70 kDa DNA-binding subunit A-like [Phoenix dactylifera]